MAVPPAPAPSLSIVGDDRRVPARRVFCVGQNYAAHAREMGSDPARQAPFFFSKPADALVGRRGPTYPSMTRDLHHEVELVCVIGARATIAGPFDHGRFSASKEIPAVAR